MTASPRVALGWLRIALELAKFRLVTLVLVTTAVGYLLAVGAGASLGHVALTLLGTALTAAGSMALNQAAEAERDGRMARTSHRPIPAGRMSTSLATALGIASATAGLAVLVAATNLLAAGLAGLVVVLYVAAYTPLKPRTTASTLVGAICGAIPPMIGWAAATGGLAFGAWLLGALLFLWQIPHFLALAWMYREDYARGGFRVLPVLDVTGRATVRLANLYIAPLLAVGIAAALAGLAGWVAALGSFLLASAFQSVALQLARHRTDRHARRLFLASLAYLPLVLGLLLLDRSAVTLDRTGPRPSARVVLPASGALPAAHRG